MKALTVKQPWAWAIASGEKGIENRTWAPAYRGPLLIHAGLKFDALAEPPIVVPSDLPTGRIVARVELVDVVPLEEVEDDPWAMGPKCWLLEGAVDLSEVAGLECSGKQMLWVPPRRVLRIVRRRT